MSFITSYCQITENKVSLNNKSIFSNNNSENWLKEIYKHLEISYPKFYKMDRLAKIGFLSVEVLKQNQIFEKYNDDEIAIAISNTISSATTDQKFASSYQNQKSPSPSLFVYTLPNIVIGEISIRNKWYGESLFQVSENFDFIFFDSYIRTLFELNKAKACICSFIDNHNDKVNVFTFFVEKKTKNIDRLEFSAKLLSNLYKIK